MDGEVVLLGYVAHWYIFDQCRGGWGSDEEQEPSQPSVTPCSTLRHPWISGGGGMVPQWIQCLPLTFLWQVLRVQPLGCSVVTQGWQSLTLQPDTSSSRVVEKPLSPIQRTLLLVLAQWVVRSLCWESWPLLDSWGCVTGWLIYYAKVWLWVCGFYLDGSDRLWLLSLLSWSWIPASNPASILHCEAAAEAGNGKGSDFQPPLMGGWALFLVSDQHNAILAMPGFISDSAGAGLLKPRLKSWLSFMGCQTMSAQLRHAVCSWPGRIACHMPKLLKCA